MRVPQDVRSNRTMRKAGSDSGLAHSAALLTGTVAECVFSELCCFLTEQYMYRYSQRNAGGAARWSQGGSALKDRESLGMRDMGARLAVANAVLCGALLLMGTLLLLAGTSQALAVEHPFTETLGAAFKPSFENAEATAVDGSGNVLVFDSSARKLSRWQANGTPADFSALGSNIIDGVGAGDETPQGGFFPAGAAEVQVAVDHSGGVTDGDIYLTQTSQHLVDIFASDGHYLGQLTASSEGALGEACGVAVDSTGAVYVGDFSGKIHKFVPSANPPVNTDNTANFTFSSACTLAAGAGPTAGFLFAAHFSGAVEKLDSGTGVVKYSVSKAPNTTVAVDPASGDIYAVAQSEVKGVKSFEVREFDASGSAGASLQHTIKTCTAVQGVAVSGSNGDLYLSRQSSSRIAVYGPALPSAPTIGESCSEAVEWTSGTTSNAATVNANIGPNGSATTFRVQYGTSMAYGSETSERGVGSDETNHTVSLKLEGLAPATTYHWRVVATNSVGSEAGPDRTFTTFGAPELGGGCVNESLRTGASARLPDCRAYEMVSPIDKEGGDILVREDLRGPAERSQSSLTGDKFAFASYRAFGNAQSSPLSSQYVASRQVGGWTSENITPPRGIGSPVGQGEFDLFSEDLCSAWIEHNNYNATTPLAPGDEPFGEALYRRSDCGPETGSYERVSTRIEGRRPTFKGFSADGGVTLFNDRGRLSQETAVALPEKFSQSEGNFTCVTAANPAATSTRWLREGTPITASGTGTLTAGSKSVSAVVTASGTGMLATGSKLVSSVNISTGRFLIGQAISGTGIPAGATIVRVVSPGELELSASATTSGSQALSAGSLPFAAGWTISGPGIPSGTTITSVSKQTMTLSAAATATAPSMTLTATATTETYTPTEEDAGHTVQCQLRANGEGGVGATQIANPAYIVAPHPASEPPVAPRTIAAPSADGSLAVGGLGGRTLSCDPGSWEGAPAFAYQWYRDGLTLSGNGAETAHYTVQASDLASSAYFQCEVIAATAGGTVAKASDPLATNPAPVGPVARPEMFSGEVSYVSYGAGKLRSICVLPGGRQSESCTAGNIAPIVELGTGGGYQLSGALSSDGAHAFWTNSTAGAGRIYERRNPTAPQSALALGQATGAGLLTSGSNEVKSLSTASGVFAVGQRVMGAGIPFGTTIATVGVGTLTLTAAATESSKVNQATALATTSECTEAERACTLGVSEAVEARENSSRFWAASQDGAKVLFGSAPNPGQGSLQNLYEFDTETATPNLIAHNTLGVLGQSKDLARIYFLSTDALAGTGENSEGASAQAGKPNLYLYRSGTGGDFSFIATLSAKDAQFEANGKPSPTSANPYWHEARVSPDGQTAAFLSTASPTGYDNTDIQSDEADAELYRYDARTEELNCVSCAPSGARPVGRNISREVTPLWMAAKLPFAINELHPARVLSDDGQRLFFESVGPLVLADTNGTADVYEWESTGSGSCTGANAAFSPRNKGCISLISSGRSPQDSELLDADPSGANVFFKTGSSLVDQDPGLFDIYDARVNGGFPSPPVPPGPCEGEACQGSALPPEPLTPASRVFRGPQNPSATRKVRCRKGRRRVMRGGKASCVPKRRHRRDAHHHRRAAR